MATLQELQDRLVEARQLLVIAQERVKQARADEYALTSDIAALERTIKIFEEKV